MNARTFVNACRIIMNLDKHVLEAAGVLNPGQVGGSDWDRLNRDPFMFLLKLPEDRLERLWTLIVSRQPKRSAEHAYFSVEPTAATIPKRGSLAIYCGDAPRRNADGSTSFSLRAPLLIMPPGMFSDAEVTMQEVADVLNENWRRFFPSTPVARGDDNEREAADETA